MTREKKPFEDKRPNILEEKMVEIFPNGYEAELHLSTLHCNNILREIPQANEVKIILENGAQISRSRKAFLGNIRTDDLTLEEKIKNLKEYIIFHQGWNAETRELLDKIEGLRDSK